MSLSRWKWLTRLSATLVMGAGLTGIVPAAEYQDSADDFAAMRERLDACEAELRELRSTAGQGQGRFASLAEEAVKEEECMNGLKEVDIITKPTWKIGGRIFVDHLIIDQSPAHLANYGDAQNRTRFDTFRIFVEGDVYENVDYKVEVAFGESGIKSFAAVETNQTQNVDRPVAKDVYLTIKELAYLQNVRIGHIKEPFSLEELTSGRFITFMERSYLNAFAPQRNIGIMEFGHVYDDETLSWYTGIFRSESDDDPVDVSEDSSDFAWTSRLAWNPYYDEPTEGRYLTHLAAAYSYREYGDNTVTYSKDHELNLLFPLGNPIAGTLAVDNVQLFGLEAAIVNGPAYAQTEWVHVATDGLAATPDRDFDSFYVQAGYFLTGEHKGYKKSSHAFDRVKVYEPFFSVRTADGICRGKGAWELKARYSYIDLNDGAFTGGRAGGFSTGVNWYLNNYTRIMFDYIYGDSYSRPITGADAGNVNEIGMRAQVDF